MCDTFAALPPFTKKRDILFAKNSDRSPNEPHQMMFFGACDHGDGENVSATYISIPQVPHVNAVMLFKPSWTWGCEMGVNEHGLVIGNEAVFTKVRNETEPTLTGMDLVRLALERAETAQTGVRVICSLLQKYGQGGNCGFDHRFTYHNSFLLADKREVWILETAGRFWAVKRIFGCGAISNRLTIERDYDSIHPLAIDYAVENRLCRDRKSFGFASCFTEPVYSFFSRATDRRSCVLSGIREKQGSITRELMMELLRSHSDGADAKTAVGRSSVSSVCMHAGGIIGDHTTGSFVASLRSDSCEYWATGASTPCFSIFKPIVFSESAPLFKVGEESAATEYWMARERIFRAALGGELDVDGYLREKRELEERLLSSSPNEDTVAEAFSAEAEFVGSAMKKFALPTPEKAMGSIGYRSYWKAKTRKLGAE